MGLALAKYRGYMEKLDRGFYYLHTLPARGLNKVFGWTKYGMSEAYAIVGFGAMLGYLVSGAMIVTSKGKGSVDSIDDILIAGTVVLASLLQAPQLYKNIRRGERGEALQVALDNQYLPEVTGYQEDLQRDRQIRQAAWYSAQLIAWRGMMELFASMGSVDMTDPFVKAIYRCATVATACIFGPRYIASSDIGSKSLEENVGGSK